nr:uncharacterized protein C8orf59 homolog isoform X3 [Pogona vitticeps]
MTKGGLRSGTWWRGTVGSRVRCKWSCAGAGAVRGSGGRGNQDPGHHQIAENRSRLPSYVCILLKLAVSGLLQVMRESFWEQRREPVQCNV